MSTRNPAGRSSRAASSWRGTGRPGSCGRARRWWSSTGPRSRPCGRSARADGNNDCFNNVIPTKVVNNMRFRRPRSTRRRRRRHEHVRGRSRHRCRRGHSPPIASRLAAAPTTAAPPGRRWERLAANDQYEAWVIAWPHGTGLPLHDRRVDRRRRHGGRAAAASATSSTMRCTAMVDARRRDRARSGSRPRGVEPERDRGPVRARLLPAAR